ncbi:MAG TPA: prenyltransferase/squalene oxidase repeat-containing protein [Nannocystaceae bacterium]|nr:prenyltransferase/squalene oxidase repeat-containing protein [Nannocystaceae bacterium]
MLALFGAALRRRELPSSLRAELARSHALGVRWLLGMQNPDGGWAAYTKGHRSKRPGAGITAPMRFPPRLGELRRCWADLPLAIGDPSTEGLSGRCVRALGLAGKRADDVALVRAREFLIAQQTDFGGWWGRWLVNYLPTTAHILLGLAEIGADLRAPWIRRAIAWVQSKQRADGGWGECAESYADPSRAGTAETSMPGLTGLVASAMIATGERDHPCTSKAIRYLLDAQDEHGAWPDHDWLAPSLPPRMFYRYPITTRFYPLAALGAWRSASR